MSVRRRTRRGGGIAWQVRWREGERQRARNFDSRAEAEEFEVERRRRARMGAHGPAEPSKDRLDAWLVTWMRRDGPSWARSTQLHRGYVCDKWLSPFLGSVRLRDLGRAEVREWRAEVIEQGATPNTANAAKRVLSAALGAAADDGLLPANPCIGIKRLPHKAAPARPLSPVEAERLRAELPTLRDRVLWGLMAYGGLRPEEGLALRWQDVRHRLHVHAAYTHGEEKGTKTGYARTVEIIPALADDLARWREVTPRGEPGDLVCPALGRADRPSEAERHGGFLHLGNWRARTFGPAAVRAGLYREVRNGKRVERRPSVIPYNGRDTFTSLLVYEGRPPILVAAALGHGDTQTLWRHYAGVFAEAEHAPRVPIAEAVAAARETVRAAASVPLLFPLAEREGSGEPVREAEKSADSGGEA